MEEIKLNLGASYEEYRNKDDGPINIEDFNGCEAYVGIDLATNRDITALSIMFERDNLFYFLN